MKKKAEKQPTRKEKEARPKKRPRAEKQPKGKGPASAGGPAGGPAGGGAEGEYDSGEEVVADDADKAFIDSDDDLDDIKKEYDAERQVGLGGLTWIANCGRMKSLGFEMCPPPKIK